MPAPSSKERKAAIDRTPTEIKRTGYINKRRPGHSGDNRKKTEFSRLGTDIFGKSTKSLRRLE